MSANYSMQMIPLTDYSQQHLKPTHKKADLILTALSWIDHLKPEFCLLENVQSFLDFKLNSVPCGIDRGGIKLLVRTLTALG